MGGAVLHGPCFAIQGPEAGEGTERARSGNVPEMISCSRESEGEDGDGGRAGIHFHQPSRMEKKT